MEDSRRASERFKRRFNARMYPYGQAVNTLDISLGGISVESPKYYAPDSVVNLEITLPDDTAYQCDATVVWIEPKTTTASVYTIGLQFIDRSEAQIETLKKVLL